MKMFLCLLLIWINITESIIQGNTNKSEKEKQDSSQMNVRLHESEVNVQRIRKHVRSRRSSLMECTTEGYYFVSADRCCKKCPEGAYIPMLTPPPHVKSGSTSKGSSTRVDKPCTDAREDTKCKACESGTYLKHPNYKGECKACKDCHADTEIVKKSCSATSDTQCSCKEGYYNRLADGCFLCTQCKDREIIRNCSENNDTVCGPCVPGFYEEDKECRPCPQSSQKQCSNSKDVVCSQLCKSESSNLPVVYSVTGAFLVLLLPVGVLLVHRHKRKKSSLEEHEFPPQVSENIVTYTEAHTDPGLVFSEDPTLCKQNSSDTSQGPLTSVLQKGSTLYDIIDSVPVKRWKEFIRILELQDKEIDIVEMEFTNSFRDQQYEMLRRWCQLRTAALESIYQALERMNLCGCAEELRIKIENYA